MHMMVRNTPAHSRTPIHLSGSELLLPQGELLADIWGTLSKSIAHRVRLALIKQGLTQKELADLIGVLPQRMSLIMKGNVNLTIKTVAKIELALGIRLLHISDEEV